MGNLVIEIVNVFKVMLKQL